MKRSHPTPIHPEPHLLAGKTVLVPSKNFELEIKGRAPTLDFVVEDWWDRVSGYSWKRGNGNFACSNYYARQTILHLPYDDEVIYGKIGAFGYLAHVSELQEGQEPSTTYFQHWAPTLEQAQKEVGGMVQLLELRDGRQLLCNEEGKIHGLPFNEEATSIADGHQIVGNAMILTDGAKWS